MKVLVTIQHPAHVHFFRNVVGLLEERGHEVKVVAREKDVNLDLLDAYDLPYELLAGPVSSTLDLARVQLLYEYRVLRVARRFQPDVITAIHGLAAAHAARLAGARSVIFVDDLAANRLTVPFADVVATPRAFPEDYGGKHVRYDGYHELAYLHPERFEPDPAALREHGVDPDERYSVVRFSDMGAHHDIGEHGLSAAGKREVVDALAEHGPVYASIEGDGDGFDGHELPIPPHLVHQLLHYAGVFVTDSSTMPTEAALLGTPAVRSNSFAGENEVMVNFHELQERYGLVYSTPDEREAIDLVRELASDPDASSEWQRRRDRLLEDKIDVAAFAADLLVGASDEDPRTVEAVGERGLAGGP